MWLEKVISLKKISLCTCNRNKVVRATIYSKSVRVCTFSLAQFADYASADFAIAAARSRWMWPSVYHITPVLLCIGRLCPYSSESLLCVKMYSWWSSVQMKMLTVTVCNNWMHSAANRFSDCRHPLNNRISLSVDPRFWNSLSNSCLTHNSIKRNWKTPFGQWRTLHGAATCIVILVFVTNVWMTYLPTSAHLCHDRPLTI